MILKRISKESYKYILTTIMLVFTALSIASMGSQKNISKLEGTNQVKAYTNNCVFDLQKAETTEEKEKGLMFIKNMQSNQGMIFLYKEETYKSFWMLNTFIPLDIIFLDKNHQVIEIHRNAETLNSKKLYGSYIKSESVVELNANTTEYCKINVQDFILIQ